MSDPWYDSNDPRRLAWGYTRWGCGIVTALLAVAGVATLALWGFGVLFAAPAGRGEAYKQQQSAVNRIQAQTQFHTNFETIHQLDTQLTNAKKAVDDFTKAHPSIGNGTPYDPLAEQLTNLQTTFTGIQQQCLRTAADYNASTESYLLQDFRDADLPYKITENDFVFTSGQFKFADFDCQVTPGEVP